MFWSKWKRLALTDDLTSTYNRRYFNRIKKKKYKYLYFADVNNLSIINKKFGFLAGDRILKETADLLLNTGKNNVVCRIGGDEFVLLTNSKFNIETDLAKITLVKLTNKNIWSDVQRASKIQNEIL